MVKPATVIDKKQKAITFDSCLRFLEEQSIEPDLLRHIETQREEILASIPLPNPEKKPQSQIKEYQKAMLEFISESIVDSPVPVEDPLEKLANGTALIAKIEDWSARFKNDLPIPTFTYLREGLVQLGGIALTSNPEFKNDGNPKIIYCENPDFLFWVMGELENFIAEAFFTAEDLALPDALFGLARDFIHADRFAEERKGEFLSRVTEILIKNIKKLI